MRIRRNRFMPGLLAVAMFSAAARAETRVDLGPNMGRNDTAAPHWQAWEIAESPSVTREFGPLKVTLSATGEGKPSLVGRWYKPLIEYGAAMAADGLTVQGGQIAINIEGLTPGRHAIVTYHNNVLERPISSLAIDLDGKPFLQGLKPGQRVRDDADVATAYIPVDVGPGGRVAIGIRSEGGTTGQVVLNGFAVDVPDPARQASRPLPANDDEHVGDGLDSLS